MVYSTPSVNAATQGGPTTQIVALGSMNMHLTGMSVVTFWRMQHTTHTNFALEHIYQQFDSQVRAGGSGQVVLARTGDLIHHQYAVIDLPGIKAVATSAATAYAASAQSAVTINAQGTDGAVAVTDRYAKDLNWFNQVNFYVHYCDAVGFAYLKELTLIVGNVVVDKFTSDYMYCWDELTGKAGKRLCDMIGKFETPDQRIAYSEVDQRLYVPLPFWYTNVSGNALSLISLSFLPVKLSITFSSLKEIIIVSNPNVKPVLAATGADLSATDISVMLCTEYVSVDTLERDKFSEGMFDQLIQTVQTQTFQFESGQSHALNLHYNHPVIELIFTVQLTKNKARNDHFNYSRTIPGADKPSPMPHQTEGTFNALPTSGVTQVVDGGFDNENMNYSGKLMVNADPITRVSLSVNNNHRFTPTDPLYFRQVQPWEKHSLIPKGYIYNYSFALYPESSDPSGSLNWSRLDSVIMTLDMHPDIKAESRVITVNARSWNIFSYIEGVGGNRFL